MVERLLKILKEPHSFARILRMRLANGRLGFDGGEEKEGSGSPAQFSNEGAPLPADLRAWIGEVELAGLVDHAVQQVGRAETTRNPTSARDVLLGIISFCYVTGSYDSEEIENALNHNPKFEQMHSLLFGHAPASAVLRSFRRANRGLIEHCLAEVLRSACEISKDSPTISGGCSARSESSDFAREAKVRLARAIQCDTWALDK